jgi:hypothetical protein
MRNNSQKSQIDAIGINELNAPGAIIQLNNLLTEFFDASSADHYESELNELMFDCLLSKERTDQSKATLFATTRLVAELLRGLQKFNNSIQIQEGGAVCA